MLKFFGGSPGFANRRFSDLSLFLYQQLESPAFKRELLVERKLNFSLESLKHFDEYLEALHAGAPCNRCPDVDAAKTQAQRAVDLRVAGHPVGLKGEHQ
jgi:hypothetical protein